MNAKLSRRLANSRAPSGEPETLLQHIQVPAAILDTPETVISLNKSALELTGLSEADLSRQPLVWSSRIVSDDKPALLEHQQRMSRRDLQTTCDYRFLPYRRATPIWLRELTIPLAGFDRPYWISTYLRLAEKDRKQTPPTESTAGEVRGDILERCFHEIKNRLHLLNMELELAQLESAERLDSAKMTNALEAIGNSVKLLQETLLPGKGRGPRSD